MRSLKACSAGCTHTPRLFCQRTRISRRVSARADFNRNDPLSWAAASEAVDEEDENGAVVQLLSVEQLDMLMETASTPTLAKSPPSFSVTVAGSSQSATTAAEAISNGLRLFKSGDAAASVALFQEAMRLPGSGTLRIKNGVRELSTGELQASYYNLACAYAVLEQPEKGMDALNACVLAGYDDGNNVRSDPDLQKLRALAPAPFDALVARISPPAGGLGFLQSLFGK